MTEYIKNVGHLYEFILEVDEIGNKYDRKVYNFEELLGMIGGILSISLALLGIIFKPFFQDNLAYNFASLTRSGKNVNINSLSFFLKKGIENMLQCEVFNLPYLHSERFNR